MLAMGFLMRNSCIIWTRPIRGSSSKTRKVTYDLLPLHILAGRNRFVKHPIVETKTGWHFCLKQYRESDFTTYGVGITLYFQFLKFLCGFFLLMTALSLPAYIFFFSGNFSDDGSGAFKQFLSRFSLGNIGECKCLIINVLSLLRL